MNTMTMDMMVLSDTELAQVDGGMIPLFAMLIGAYTGLLDKIEKNPEQYTWMMDWYYS